MTDFLKICAYVLCPLGLLVWGLMVLKHLHLNVLRYGLKYGILDWSFWLIAILMLPFFLVFGWIAIALADSVEE